MKSPKRMAAAVLRRLAGNQRRSGGREWEPRARELSDLIAVAERPPPMRVNMRRNAADQYITGLRETLETHPEGWSGAIDDGDDLQRRVDARLWYHTLELPGGVVTPGAFDLRPIVAHYGIPERLDGKRALDIGTWDGFWAFEFERRGADVTAIDLDRLSQIDFPAAIRHVLDASGLDQRFGGGFEVAKAALGSNVERVGMSIYDLDPAELGTFDVVHVGEVLQHLESPSRALRHVRSVTKDLAIIGITFDPDEWDGPVMRYRGGWNNAVWWTASLDAIAQMVVDAGFSQLTLQTAYHLISRTGGQSWEAVLHARP